MAVQNFRLFSYPRSVNHRHNHGLDIVSGISFTTVRELRCHRGGRHGLWFAASGRRDVWRYRSQCRRESDRQPLQHDAVRTWSDRRLGVHHLGQFKADSCLGPFYPGHWRRQYVQHHTGVCRRDFTTANPR